MDRPEDQAPDPEEGAEPSPEGPAPPEPGPPEAPAEADAPPAYETPVHEPAAPDEPLPAEEPPAAEQPPAAPEEPPPGPAPGESAADDEAPTFEPYDTPFGVDEQAEAWDRDRDSPLAGTGWDPEASGADTGQEAPGGLPPGPGPSPPWETPARRPLPGGIDPRVLIGILALIGAGLLAFVLLRGGDDEGTERAAQTRPATPETSLPAALPGWKRVVSEPGGYGVDVPPRFTSTQRNQLVTFRHADRSRAYAVNGDPRETLTPRSTMTRLTAVYRRLYRLRDVRIQTVSANEVRLRARGDRKANGMSQRIYAAVFRPRGARRGVYVVQGFFRLGDRREDARARAEFLRVRSFMRPLN